MENPAPARRRDPFDALRYGAVASLLLWSVAGEAMWWVVR